MYKTLVLALVVLFSVGWLQAQAGSSSGTSGVVTIQGCLQVSNERYSLIDSSGKTHKLTGDANKLKEHVGHEVQITGTPAVRTTDTTVQGSESTARETPVLRVQSVKHLADTCKTN